MKHLFMFSTKTNTKMLRKILKMILIRKPNSAKT